MIVQEGKLTSVKEEQFTKALFPIFSQIGKLIVDNFVHLAKALIDSIWQEGKAISDKFEHPSNAVCPTEEQTGKEIFVKFVQLKKAVPPICSQIEQLIPAIVVLFANAPVDILYTFGKIKFATFPPLPITILVKADAKPYVSIADALPNVKYPENL